MARRNKGPWRRKQDNCWYTKVNGKQIKLAEAEVSYQDALKLYHEAHAHAKKHSSELPITVAQIIDEYLEWLKFNRAPGTYRWYYDYLQSFVDHIGAKLKVNQLKPLHVERWLQASYAKAGSNHRRGAIKAIKRALNWAVEMDAITHNPVAKMKAPAYERREGHLTQEQFDDLMEKIKSECFRDYLDFLWLTGCRPMEVRQIEAQHLQGDKIVLPVKQSKGKRYNRVIYLTPEALKMVKRLAKEVARGPLFRNSQGNPWTSNAVRCRFRNLGIEDVCATTLRHSWVTKSLENGVDTTTVAVLAGHRDPTMVQRNYQHLAANHEHLASAARRANGDSGSSQA